MPLLIDRDVLLNGLKSTVYEGPSPNVFNLDCITEIRSINDIVKEKMDEYRELMRLQALGCKNCGGSINRETMTCEYCGTNYRN